MDFAKESKDKEETITALHAELAQAATKAKEDEAQYSDLKEKYAKQISLRLGDKATLDEAWEYFQETHEENEALKANIESLEEQSRDADKQHKAELQAKDREMEQMEQDNRDAIAVLEHTHKMEMDAKAEEAEEVTLAYQEAAGLLRNAVGNQSRTGRPG